MITTLDGATLTTSSIAKHLKDDEEFPFLWVPTSESRVKLIIKNVVLNSKSLQ